MKKTLTAIVLGLCAVAHAQTLDNILDLTAVQNHGTARYTALGGAFTALGNDISGLHYNPAGIGVFRRDHFNLGLGISANTSNTDYGSFSNSDVGGNFLLEDIGFVKTIKGTEKSNYAFGISYVKKADFNRNLTANTLNRAGENLTEYWFLNSEGKTVDELLNEGLFEEVLAFDNFITDLDSGSSIITNRNYTLDESINQNYVINKTGGQNDLAFTFGGKYSRFLNWGVSLNIPFMRTTTISTYSESGFDSNSDLNNHSVTREENFSATGVNANMGVIITPLQWLRAAVSYQTPTRYSYFSSYQVSARSVFNNGDTFEADPILAEGSGTIVTPGILRTGLAFVIGKYGFISAGYDRSDLSSAQTEFEFDQQLIENELRVQETVRLGGELRLNQYSIRAGYTEVFNPFVADNYYYENKNMISGGFGYRKKNYALDFSYVHATTDRNLPTYGTDENELTENLTSGSVIATLSIMF